MDRISWNDHRKIAVFARSLYGLESVQVISQRVIQGLDDLIRCNSAWIVHNGRHTRSLNIWAENVGPNLHKLAPTLWALRHEHPGIKNLRLYATRTIALSDLLPLHQWRKTALFNEVYSKLGMHEQLAGAFPYAWPELAGMIVNRSRRTFTERDRLVLNLLRFHVSEACRNANMVEVNTAEAIAEAFVPLLDGGTIVLDRTDNVLFISAQAHQHLESFFALEKPFRGGIPETVRQWVRRELGTFDTDALAVRPPQTLVIRRGETTLQVRLSPGPAVHVLVLRVEAPGCDVEKLRPIGLGHRATEVLYWVGQGKTNEEIALILGMSRGTVKTHLKTVFARLGVENRASAAATISAFLAWPHRWPGGILQTSTSLK
jgi:DNA-binding CsgD family transcriptional regulator